MEKEKRKRMNKRTNRTKNCADLSWMERNKHNRAHNQKENNKQSTMKKQKTRKDTRRNETKQKELDRIKQPWNTHEMSGAKILELWLASVIVVCSSSSFSTSAPSLLLFFLRSWILSFPFDLSFSPSSFSSSITQVLTVLSSLSLSYKSKEIVNLRMFSPQRLTRRQLVASQQHCFKLNRKHCSWSFVCLCVYVLCWDAKTPFTLLLVSSHSSIIFLLSSFSFLHIFFCPSSCLCLFASLFFYSQESFRLTHSSTFYCFIYSHSNTFCCFSWLQAPRSCETAVRNVEQNWCAALCTPLFAILSCLHCSHDFLSPFFTFSFSVSLLFVLCLFCVVCSAGMIVSHS